MTLSTSPNWTHTWFVLLWLAYFAQQRVLEIHPYGSMCQNFLLSKGWVILRRVFSRPFLSVDAGPMDTEAKCKGFEHPWILVSVVGPGSNPPQILRDDLFIPHFVYLFMWPWTLGLLPPLASQGPSWPDRISQLHPMVPSVMVLISRGCGSLFPHLPFTLDSQLLKYRCRASKLFTLISPWPRNMPGSHEVLSKYLKWMTRRMSGWMDGWMDKKMRVGLSRYLRECNLIPAIKSNGWACD